ncbi:hypothetical protein ACQCVN_21630 [Rossellomorea aquimaris]
MKKGTLAAHNIHFLFWSQIFGSIRFITPVLTLFYFSRGLDETLILLVMTFFSLGVLIGEVPTGIFADRFRAKLSFLVAQMKHYFMNHYSYLTKRIRWIRRWGKLVPLNF